MCTSVELVLCNGQHITYQHRSGEHKITRAKEFVNSCMERKELTLSFHNLIKRDEELYGYTNYSMETPTLSGDCFQGVFPESLSSPGSQFDDSLAVALPVIQDVTDDGKDPEAPAQKSVPFKLVHEPPAKFNSGNRKVFVKGLEIKVRFVENERSVTTHLLYPNLYTIELQHGDFTWSIKMRYKHIMQLHQQLIMYKASLKVPFPTKSHKNRRESFKQLSAETAEQVALQVAGTADVNKKREGRPKKRKGALPRFPKTPEVMISYDAIQLRMKQLEEYLFNLLNISIYRNHHETLKFLEVSELSFISELGSKGKEGMILKRTGSTQPGQAGCNCFGLLNTTVCVRCNYFCSGMMCARWQERWMFVKDTCFGYIRPRDGVIKAVMLFDQGFEVSSGMYSTGMNNGIQILNHSRQLIIKCWTRRKAREWLKYLKRVAGQTAREFTHPNLHYSFAPTRQVTQAAPLVDGSAYFAAVADAIDLAKEEIFIADWWLSPEIYLKRPALSGQRWRLDALLKKKAQEGVKVFIMLYKEVRLALGINSLYSKSKFRDCENIKVFRHPDHANSGVLFWAHHEKIVVVDQTVAFVGGIDLCYGRWDDYLHRLTDLGNIKQPEASVKTRKKTSSSPGGGVYFSHGHGNEFIEAAKIGKFLVVDDIDIQQETKTDQHDVKLAEIQEEDDQQEQQQQNLPVLDPGDKLLMATGDPGTDINGDCPDAGPKRKVLDKITDRTKELMGTIYPPYEEERIGKDFEDAERRKAKKYAKSLERALFVDEPVQIQTEVTPVPLAEEKEGRVITASHIVEKKDLEGNTQLWVGKDYTNFIVKDFENLDRPYDDNVDRTTTPRMPWHDVGAVIVGAAARDVARHFIQRWNAIKLEKARQKTNYPYLLPKAYNNVQPSEDMEKFLKTLDIKTVCCQVVRSVSCWSCGFLDPDTVEQSIHEAYVDAIIKAQHYIYIENQFFITLSGSNGPVRNQIGEALFNRIIRAHRNQEVFRVYVVMPLLPGFEGEVGTPTGTSLHAVTHWNYQSISREDNGIIYRLKKAGIEDPSEYITFHGLRAHSLLGEEPVTELVYVHSKLLIADDKTVICGSANINDRSMIGTRDSEIAVVIQDEQFDDGVVNGEKFPCGRFAGSLRKKLFREHLGLMDVDPLPYSIDDPCSQHFYRNIWKNISKTNTEMYEKVFHPIPTDAIHTFEDLKNYQKENCHNLWHYDRAAANRHIDLIQGHLVDLPLEFLCDAVLTPRNTSMEGMMPTSLWT